MNTDTENAAEELVACLRKYQARYHGAPHAKKDWDRADRALRGRDVQQQPVSEPPVSIPRMVSVQWIKECAQLIGLASIALACTGEWKMAFGAAAAAWTNLH
jgi:hypothetical protein